MNRLIAVGIAILLSSSSILAAPTVMQTVLGTSLITFRSDVSQASEWFLSRDHSISWFEEKMQEAERERRANPRYEVFKNGHRIEVCVDLQWFLFDISNSFQICEKLMYGIMMTESAGNPNTVGDSGASLGLMQLNSMWFRENPLVWRYRDNVANRDPFNPYDNLVTSLEVLNYIRATYSLDLNTDSGIRDLLFSYNAGGCPSRRTLWTRWNYDDIVLRHAAELVQLQP